MNYKSDISVRWFSSYYHLFAFVFASFTALSAQPGTSSKHWVGTWGCAVYSAQSNTPPKPLAESTLRQIVRVSIGGDTLRVKFSNITSPTSTTLKSVNIAASTDGTKSTIDAGTIKTLTFNNNPSVTIDANSLVTSDPVAFDLKPGMRLAITIYYGQIQTNSEMSFHYGSRTNSYILSGDQTSSADFSGATPVERWYTINAIEVLAPDTAAVVVALGNSITDGYGLSGGLQNRWTDAFSEALLKDGRQIGVLNMGIGATLVTSASNGAKSGLERFKQDVLDQVGIKWVIVLYGINDINAGVNANTLIDAFKKMAADAHAKNIKIYGATLTPHLKAESVRKPLNDWIRNNDILDGVIDFDKAVRNPNDTTQFLQQYNNDGLHPNAAGYKAMGESIDLNLFNIPKSEIKKETQSHNGYTFGEIHSNTFNGNTFFSFEIPGNSFVSLKMYSLLGKEIAELAGRYFPAGRHTLQYDSNNMAKGMYILYIKTDKISASRNIIFNK